MRTARRTILGMGALSLVLASPRPASAAIIDIIWGMSGPQMIGIVSECTYVLASTNPVCRLLDKRVTGTDADDPYIIRADGTRRVWLAFDGTFYFSDGYNSEDLDYKAFDYYMVAFEPMLQLQSYAKGRCTVYHGVLGLSYDMLFGSGFDKFDNIGVKFRPIGVTVGNFEIAYNLRIYPRGFTSADFGVEAAQPKPRPDNETVHGFTVGLRW